MSASTTQRKPLSTTEAFIFGGLAACCAVTVSNPAEVAKTRLQLQGELAKDGGVRVYRNTFDVLAKTWRNEGMWGVQRGLGPAYIYQILVNGARLGFYEPFRQTINRLARIPKNESNALTSVLAGATSGAVGASLGNPLFLVKARMQHRYKGSLHALRTILYGEGLRGLSAGMSAAILRTAAGSSVQVPSYLWTKSQLVHMSPKHFSEDGFTTFLASSSVSGICVLTVMQPTDTVLTRMYNQPTTILPSGRRIGKLYRNPIDALIKIAKVEGHLGWYKGSTAHFLRITPHTIITLTANDIIVNCYRRMSSQQQIEQLRR